MALKLILAILSGLHCVTSQSSTPNCLQTCIAESQTALCAKSALSTLTPCLVRTCVSQPAAENLIASLDVTISPKAEYSCQQSYGPSKDSEGESSAVTLPLNGSCTNSPYGFKSFVAQGVSRIRASSGCRVMTFSEEDCLGETGAADVGAMSSGQCVFRGGRSARLACRSELDAARAFIQTSCDTDSDDNEETNASASSSTTVYPSSAPYHGPGPTSSLSDTSSPIPFHWPFSSPSNSGSESSPTNTADATGSNHTDETTLTVTLPASGSALPTDITHTVTLPSASSNGTVATSHTAFGNSTAQDSVPQPTAQNATLTLSLPSSLTAPVAATGLATCLNVQSGLALGLVAAFAALFL